MGILSEFAAECEHYMRHFRRSTSTQLFFGAATVAGLAASAVGTLGILFTSSYYLFATILIIGVSITLCPIGVALLLGMYMLSRAFVKG
jgi:hypothetical protein